MKTTLGKWSVGLMIAFVIFILFMNILIWTGQEGGETFFDNLLLSIPVTLGALCAVASFITGLVSIFKYKEKSKIVILITIFGLLVMIFLVAEFTTDH